DLTAKSIIKIGDSDRISGGELPAALVFETDVEVVGVSGGGAAVSEQDATARQPTAATAARLNRRCRVACTQAARIENPR
ncbi:hypothetical protein, partial [Mycobacterium colombiense]|uniref:hypothetical protein n=1 Tax=Mycobacterium colombiense TaxID=339268 RepID=UPI00080106B6